MNLDALLSKLKEFQIYVAEDRQFSDGSRVLIFRSELPAMPHGHQRIWATLALEPNQKTVEREEIESILDHLHHGSALFFGDELERELLPMDQSECLIAERVTEGVRELSHGSERWDDHALIEEIKTSLGFELTAEQGEYLEAYIRLRRHQSKA